ncbi:glycosyl transferase [Flavobacterium palustre]|uniref:Glycosyl transferase n=2 Tax=Flavobacterium palustre TaxID=1476463 RepID=A0ABQ1HRJ6_9FLAO|nr:glycosyl transferase [Flavobacterium palustre]
MASYNLDETFFLSSAIGYVEESPFIKVNKKVKYPTWQMSSNVGGIHTSVLNRIKAKINADADFDYFLNSVAKLGMMAGLFCYSEPRLLINKAQKVSNKKTTATATLFRFVKQHYKKRWLLLLLLNLLVYEKRFPLIAFSYALFFKSRRKIKFDLDTIPVQSNLAIAVEKTIDVVIPTIGRKQYLYNVLQDLASQTHLPQKVIIVEQNPNPEISSELDYLTNQSWPFTIKHIFTHQVGACNSRNLALAEVDSEWSFMADDDIRFENSFFEKAIAKAIQYGVSTFTTSCLQPNEIQHYKTIHQSGIFGSGNSFVKKTALESVCFDKALEFGYGEDTDFGMQLRHWGYDVIYFPDLKITHLKAPIGGFRIPIKKQWESETIQPKPSPTIMYMKMKHFSQEQINSYKLVLFLKLLRQEALRDYLGFYKNFRQKWNKSVYWANQLR